MKIKPIIFFAILFLLPNIVFAGKTKIKLTGTISESIEMTIGNTGRTEIISALPYEFQLEKEELPIILSFRSNNYEYITIEIPKKPVDDIGHVYLLKQKEVADIPLYAYNNVPNKDQPKIEINGIDTTHGVNAAPYTGIKAENTFALIIANEKYEMASDVEMANNDGLAVKEYCSKTLGMKDKQILYYPNATYGKINKAIRDVKSIAEAYGGKINLIVYYAGHGIPDNETKDAYIMPVDADGTDPAVCFSLKKLYNELDAMHLNQSVVFLDACFSGAQRDGDMIVAARGVAIKPQEEKPQGNTIVFSATSDSETAFSYKEQKHGLFTYFFLKMMQDKKGKMSLGDLADYIIENVSRESILINGKKQTPAVIVPQNIGNQWKNWRLYGK
ncbi:MAG: caspase family protein [Prevotella sp.]|nr:caspase family protein [Prevotella sp.]